MTDPDLARLSAYLRRLADLMGLRDWTFEVLPEPAGDGAAAEICRVAGRKHAKVRFARDWHGRTPEWLRATCCHEIIHCHHAAVDAEAERRLSPANFATHDMLQEYAVDGMAEAWAVNLPLPLWMTANPQESPRMGRQRPKPVEGAETKPKARPKGKAKEKGKTPAK